MRLTSQASEIYLIYAVNEGKSKILLTLLQINYVGDIFPHPKLELTKSHTNILTFYILMKPLT